MHDISKKLVLRNRRSRPCKRGISQFDVLGLETDRDLIRALAQRLAEAGPAAISIRAAVHQLIATGNLSKGRILGALRRSPLAHTNLDLKRADTSGRKVGFL